MHFVFIHFQAQFTEHEILEYSMFAVHELN